MVLSFSESPYSSTLHMRAAVAHSCIPSLERLAANASLGIQLHTLGRPRASASLALDNGNSNPRETYIWFPMA
ncbi:predicted protein [Sclerotinia sclerotiorum 1980 UF-70]|uniref:Uncharacterized protein n=1 Tax=Sclerotinia sclerotiorum (strain ATCC 18683 / 1980 / Ss-1) TaxID=665079 RepID=A7ENZ6_SCLS1|nr:predicted protein [Sclerotinia sclerotiorum 1980 UF-70]EDO04562.1 predicted protein [Sclerotinia sclerotiorum 1980 UF-70]